MTQPQIHPQWFGVNLPLNGAGFSTIFPIFRPPQCQIHWVQFFPIGQFSDPFSNNSGITLVFHGDSYDKLPYIPQYFMSMANKIRVSPSCSIFEQNYPFLLHFVTRAHFHFDKVLLVPGCGKWKMLTEIFLMSSFFLLPTFSSSRLFTQRAKISDDKKNYKRKKVMGKELKICGKSTRTHSAHFKGFWFLWVQQQCSSVELLLPLLIVWYENVQRVVIFLRRNSNSTFTVVFYLQILSTLTDA